jgi:hypothetical protein
MTYFISTSGSDSSGTGTLANPWGTFLKLNSIALVAGDIVYFRAGTYNATNSTPTAGQYVVISGKNGTSANPILISSYPPDFSSGGRVVLNLNSPVPPNTGAGLDVFTLAACSWIKIYGIAIDGPLQATTGNLPACWVVATNNGLFTGTKCHDITFENCEARNSMNGFVCPGGDNITYLNCDVHHMKDPFTGGTTGPYSGADGFSRTGTGNLSQNTIYKNCRSWNNTDDGWDCFNTAGLITYDGCWSFKNGYDENDVPRGDGNGFKMGPNGGTTGLLRLANNCLAFANKNHGFDQNDGTCTARFYNCSSINNVVNDWKFGFHTPIAHIFRNNLSLVPPGGLAGHDTSSSSSTDDDAWDASFNSWQLAVTVNSSDFTNLNIAELSSARQPDGSLPVIGCAHLVAGSDLIDKGTNVGLPFNGSFPDLGAFETGSVAPPNTVWWVATTGNDSTNTGMSSSSPFLTLAKAESVVAAGHVVNIQNGTYAGITTSHNGTSGNNIVFQAVNSGGVNISSVITIPNNFRTFKGMVFTGLASRAMDVQGANNLLQNITVNINYTSDYGIRVGQDSVTGGTAASNNVLDNVRVVSSVGLATNQTVHGVLFGGGGTGNVLKNSYISNTSYGLVNKGEIATLCFNNVFNFTNTVSNSAMYDKASSNSQYFNNTCRMFGSGYGFLIQQDDITLQLSSGAIVRNNIFVRGSADPIIGVGNGQTPASIATMTNNCYQYTTGSVFHVNSPVADYQTLAQWQSATGKDSSSIAATPTFVNNGGTTSADYKPTAGSPVINAGVAIASRTTDAGGQNIIGNPDIGAWEFQVAGGAAIYYIDTNHPSASNSNNGTSLSTPWKDFQGIPNHINTVANFVPGDVINIRAGTYVGPTTNLISECLLINGQNGSSAAHILITAYPPDFACGARVIFDCTNVVHDQDCAGIVLRNCSWIDVSGIYVKGPGQRPGSGGTGTTNSGIWSDGTSNNIFINCEASNTMFGFRLDNGTNTSYNNCDSHDNADPLTTSSPNNQGSGFWRRLGTNTATGTVYYGCRAWYNSNTGFDVASSGGVVDYDHCWAYKNGQNSVGTLLGVGIGFRAGPDNGTTGIRRNFRFCVAANNRFHGYDQNTGTATSQFYNCDAINNGGNDWKYGYNLGIAHVFWNDLSFGNCPSGSGCVPIDGSPSSGDSGSWNQSNNSWMVAGTIDASDFKSLDDTQLLSARLCNTELPFDTITYAHPANGSELIDAGRNVGFPFQGLAPEIGAFEVTPSLLKPYSFGLIIV